jgi:hypothetical protein
MHPGIAPSRISATGKRHPPGRMRRYFRRPNLTGIPLMNAELGVDGSDFLGFPKVPPRSVAGRAPSGPGAAVPERELSVFPQHLGSPTVRAVERMTTAVSGWRRQRLRPQLCDQPQSPGAFAGE